MAEQATRSPVSDALEREVCTELRKKGVQLVWLDGDGQYGGFVDGLRERWARGEFPYPVVAYRGSFLELMMQLEGLVDGTEHRAVLIHMPGYGEKDITQTPVYEHYTAGQRWRKGFSTLIADAAAGKVAPEAIEGFLDGDGITLDTADAWLVDQTRETSLLDQLELYELWCRLTPDGSEALPDEEAKPVDVLEHLRRRVGLDEAWLKFIGLTKTPADLSLNDLADALATRALAVEYVDDLQRAPHMGELQRLSELPDKIVADCRGLAEFMRKTSGFQRTYVRVAEEFEARLTVEKEEGRPEDLGNIDTFRFEEELFLEGALEALGTEEWDRAAGWAARRNADTSFWVSRQPKRSQAWSLIRAAARLGQALSEHLDPLAGAQSLVEAVQAYASGAHLVDQAHRAMEQRRAALLEPGLPEFGELRSRLDEMRQHYRQWADDLAERFNALCEQHGFIGTESLQQRHLFDQVVEPWTHDNEKVALFMVDALRYEMAVELREELRDEVATATHLDGRLAELPSVTAVGMNALAPVTEAGGRLRPILTGETFKGFETSVFQVRDPETRRKMMQHRAGGRTCPLYDLHEVLSGEKDLAKVVAEASLFIVHSMGLDEVGEKGYGQLTFDTTLRDIRSAIRLLREAGVQRFVLTSDHGFLLLDDTTVRRHTQGKKTDPNARWRLYPGQQKANGLTSVSLSALNYADTDGWLVMPRDTSIFDTGNTSKNFVHGGNSLQERVIPVLKIEYRRKPGGSTTRYKVDAKRGESVFGMHCVLLEVSREQGMLDLGGTSELELSLRVPEDPDVTVELCDVRGGATRHGASIKTPVDKQVELFFKLRAPQDRRAKVELYSPTSGDSVEPKTLDVRFEVAGTGKAPSDEETAEAPTPPSTSGLEELPDDARWIFEQVLEHGAIDERAATRHLGSGRKFRRFSTKFEDYVAKLPFSVEIRWNEQKRLKEYVLKNKASE